MIQTRQIGSHTEIYSDKNGGGKSETYITQSKTTVFHDFFTRKFLGEGETVEDFMEVSQTERDRLQGIRDSWVRPPQVFIDQWNTACGIWGRYNEETGYFELNGLMDITYEEALDIMAVGPLIGNTTNIYPKVSKFKRTHLPRTSRSKYGYRSTIYNPYTYTFDSGCYEVINLNHYLVEESLIVTEMSHYTIGAKKFIGVLELDQKTNFNALQVTRSNVEHILIKSIRKDADMHSCPKLDLESVRFMIENSANEETPVTWTYNKKVYAKITGDTSVAEAADLSEEELQEWMSLLQLAAARNITIACYDA